MNRKIIKTDIEQLSKTVKAMESKQERELKTARNQYNKVVEQNKKLQQLAKQQGDSYEYCIQELEKKFEKVLEIAKRSDMPSCLMVDCNCDICHDEVTENSKRCMKKGLFEIIKVLEHGSRN